MNSVSVKSVSKKHNATKFFCLKRKRRERKNHLHCLCLIARLKNTFFYTDDDDMIAVKLESKLHSFRCRFGIQSVVRLWVIVCLAFLFFLRPKRSILVPKTYNNNLLFKSCFFYTAPLFF